MLLKLNIKVIRFLSILETLGRTLDTSPNAAPEQLLRLLEYGSFYVLFIAAHG
jgi:hypothetical protein